MQKKLIALAVAGLVSAPAFAQSNVTVYGIVDMFVGHSKAGDTKATDVINGGLAGSRLGFRGVEDLGNGLKAVFTLEYHLAPESDAGVGTAGARQQFVGLSGNFGTVSLGRQYAPGFGATFSLGAIAAGPLDPIAVLTSDLGISPGGNARWNDSIKYVSPSFSGFSAEAIYSFTGKNGDGSVADATGENRMDNNDLGLGLTYNNGPLNVRYVYQAAENTADAEQDEHLIGASYNFGVMKLTGSYQIAKFDTPAPGDRDVKVATIGGIIPVGAGNIHVSIGKRWDDNSNADAKSYGLAYTHGLSKRTTLYAGVNRTSNDNNAAFGSVIKAAGENETAVAVGINHTF